MTQDDGNEGSLFETTSFPNDGTADTPALDAPGAPHTVVNEQVHVAPNLEQLTQTVAASHKEENPSYVQSPPEAVARVKDSCTDAAVELRLGRNGLTRIVQGTLRRAAAIAEPIRDVITNSAVTYVGEKQEQNKKDAKIDYETAIITLHGASGNLATEKQMLQSAAAHLPHAMKLANADSPTYQNIAAQIGDGKGLYQQRRELQDKSDSYWKDLKIAETQIADLKTGIERSEKNLQAYITNAGTGAPKVGLESIDNLRNQLDTSKQVKQREEIRAVRLNMELSDVLDDLEAVNEDIAAAESVMYSAQQDFTYQSKTSSMLKRVNHTNEANQKHGRVLENIEKRQRDSGMVGVVLTGLGEQAKESYARIDHMQQPSAQIDPAAVLPNYKARNAVSKMQAYEASDRYLRVRHGM